MTTTAILGGTGFTGSFLVSEAAARGHRVISLSRSLPAEPVDGVRYEQGTLADAAPIVEAADVVVGAVSARGDNVGILHAAYEKLAGVAADSGTRLIIVGGYNSLRPEPGAPRFAEGELAPAYAAEALEMNAVLESLLQSPQNLDWLFVSPAAKYGASVPTIEPRGTYRVGDDVVLRDEEGKSSIAGPDFATAVVDEIEKPTRHRAHISFAY